MLRKSYQFTNMVRSYEKGTKMLRNKLRKTLVMKLPSYEIVTPPIGIIYYDVLWCIMGKCLGRRVMTSYHWNVRQNILTWRWWMNDKITWRHARIVPTLFLPLDVDKFGAVCFFILLWRIVMHYGEMPRTTLGSSDLRSQVAIFVEWNIYGTRKKIFC
jgi:hypothetical protein